MIYEFFHEPLSHRRFQQFEYKYLGNWAFSELAAIETFDQDSLNFIILKFQPI